MRPGCVIGIAMIAALAGCVRPTPYKPSENGTGFSDQQLDSSHYRIRFAGNSRTSRETVESYMLFHAAEVTLAAGGGHFRVVDSDTSRQVDYLGPGYGYPGPGYGYGYGLSGIYGRRHSGVGISYSTGYGNAITSYEAVATIVVFPGPRSEGDSVSYDARSVVDTLGPSIRYPEPQ